WDDVRVGGTSPLDGTSTVSCPAPVTSRYVPFAGIFDYGSGCEPLGGDKLVDFPATEFDDNYDQILAYINHTDADGAEIKAMGGTPIAASLRDIRADLVATTLPADARAACRNYSVVVLTDGGESCEAVQDAIDAAAALQGIDLGGGVTIDVAVHVIGFAICPPGDPNCQTIQDLDAIADAGCSAANEAAGLCRNTAFRASNQLELQAALAEIVQDSIKTELCNGLDDDCDGEIDEDFPSLGSPCSEGVGACLDTGTFVCTADQLGVECDATPGTGTPEVCNGVDDDCNGLVDDGISCTPCTPQTEVCNGLDDDCDGEIDEPPLPGVGDTCGIDIGECAFGTTTCAGSSGVVCTGGTGPSPEVCDGKDNDCDTIVDGISRKCYTAATGCDLATDTCVGVCQFGIETCDVGAGAFGACVGEVTPSAEIPCNGLDDDCDGEIDETAGAEVCDGIDNDCDGQIDEGNPGGGGSCGTPPFVGECAPGTLTCLGGSLVCVGEIDPTPETCDGKDNDCNGAVDDGLGSPFGDPCGTDVGECSPGTLRCVGGAPECVGEVGPAAEVCDGKDNNCNGLTDETDPMLGTSCDQAPGGVTVPSDAGECRFGVWVCNAGSLECTGAVGPTAELCNGLDDDCDGAIDEDFPDLGTACDNGMTGVCRFTGTTVCAPGGAGTECDAPPGSPGTEVCNGLDDDCDGEVDENPPGDPLPVVGTECSPAIGMCEPGYWECNDGMLECGSPSSGSPEICNGEDDDCDGFVDESPVPGEGEDCTDPGFEAIGDTGECEFGSTACVNGTIECVGYQGPRPEVCNGLDDDCDGEADEFAECPDPSNLCHEGTCIVPCESGEFPCPGGFSCMTFPEGRFCVPDPCAAVTCDPGFRCDPTTGDCVDLCAGVECRDGEECRNGFCLDCFDLPAKCMEGEVCMADDAGVGQCVDRPCDPNPCMPDEVCKDDTCMPCDCGPMEICIDGACQPDRCAGVDCPFDKLCNPDTGECENPNCEGVSCKPGEVCVPISGECIPDPCSTGQCPAGDACVLLPNGGFACEPPAPPPVDYVTAAGGGCRAAPGGRGDGGGLTALVAAWALALARRRRTGGRR
ncbi:MAG: hypothetical protein D6689_14195, partial [Deltaproteobacteria bacterium]